MSGFILVDSIKAGLTVWATHGEAGIVAIWRREDNGLWDGEYSDEDLAKLLLNDYEGHIYSISEGVVDPWDDSIYDDAEASEEERELFEELRLDLDHYNAICEDMRRSEVAAIKRIDVIYPDVLRMRDNGTLAKVWARDVTLSAAGRVYQRQNMPNPRISPSYNTSYICRDLVALMERSIDQLHADALVEHYDRRFYEIDDLV